MLLFLCIKVSFLPYIRLEMQEGTVMKKIWILLCVAALCLGGCKSKEPPMKMPEAEGYNTQGEKTVVYHTKEATFPLSFTMDGAQQIQNGVYWYYELADAFGRSWEDSFYTYSAKDLELNGNMKYAELGKKSCYATNGDWPLFLNPVHTQYSISNQDQVAENLVSMVQQQLTHQQMEQASAIITDTWACDLDGDQSQELLFKACNCNEKKEDGAPQYCFLAFVKGEDCQILYSSFRPDGTIGIQSLSPLVYDPEGDGKWSVMVHQKGDYESFCAYQFSGGNFTKCYEIYF